MNNNKVDVNENTGLLTKTIQHHHSINNTKKCEKIPAPNFEIIKKKKSEWSETVRSYATEWTTLNSNI